MTVKTTARIRIATANPLPEPDVDEPLLTAALTARGVASELCAWDDGSVDWHDGTPVVIRSTWDYFRARDAFVGWADGIAGLHNPAEIVRWNSHKGYLLALEERGVPIVPTQVIAPGTRIDRDPDRTVWVPSVVKPAVGAGSFGARRFGADQRYEAVAYITELGHHGDVLVQPYMPAVDTTGERSLVWIDGTFTHAMRKSPRFADGHESVTGPHPIAPDELAVATRALAPFASQLLYARVDLVRDASGSPVVMELELIEPSLFLKQHPPALDRLADAIARLA